MNAQQAKELIIKHGIFGLGNYDGCLCTNFEVCGVHVDVSCRKSSGSSMFGDFYGTLVRVHSRHMDAAANDLKLVAAEVVKQVQEHEGYLPIKVRFCDYHADKDASCAYCAKPRSKFDGYLCEECRTKEIPHVGKIADRYEFDRLARDLVDSAMVPANSESK